MEQCALIMAGGKGTRFWPKSTDEKPKQFLNLIGNQTMIQMTYDRINKLISKEKIFVVTCKKYKELVQEQLPELPEKNIIIEPEGRNTAPCILLATLYIKQFFENAEIAVFPSDHIVNDEDMFVDELKLALDYIENENQNAIITLGISPNRPETGYGYIKCSDEIARKDKFDIVKVERFVEKPNIEKAKQYLEDGKYLWNAGMFIFHADYMLEELRNNLPDEYQLLVNLPRISEPDYTVKLEEKYSQCESISIDYAVMEKSNNIYVIPSKFGWDDIGTWKSLQRYIEEDNDSNIIKGDVDTYNSKNNVIYAGDKKIIILGLDNIFCIESDNMIVIGNKDELNNVHEYRKKYC